ncbi:hypothetical protein M3J09_010405 [Ascochyta lentis]
MSNLENSVYRSRASSRRSSPSTASEYAIAGRLCVSCLDVLSELGASGNRPQVHKLSSQDGCRLCKLFLRSKKTNRNNISRTAPELFVVVWSSFGGTGIEFRVQRGRTHVGRGTPTGWLISNRIHANIDHHLHSRVLQKDKVEWDIVKDWIRHCRGDHARSCGLKQPLAIAGFQVIDCVSRGVVQLPDNLRFAALSYCWGRSRESPTFARQLPERTSRVVEDAITATRRLGLHYLWVDRHCIDQSDSNTKHTLIQNMDRIYHNAAITIIDAAGADPRYGLPGVSSAGRRSQEIISFKGQKLISIPNMQQVVSSSKWGMRGWTYQEGLLSRRRLVFTDTQVYFQCLEQHFCESLSVPLEHVSRTYQREVKPLMQHTQAFPSQGAGTLHHHLYERIQEYLFRRLSHDSDVLHAFTGILHHFLRMEKPVYHIWGIPFKDSSTTAKNSIQGNFLAALLWLPSFDWKGTKFTRRAEFPSWSWAGWKGIAGVKSGHEVAKTCNVVKDIEISVEMEDGQQLTVAEYVARIQEKDHGMYRFRRGLHVVGWTTYVRLIQYEQLSRSDSDLSDRGSTSVVDVLDETARHKLCQATIMTHYSDGRPVPNPDELFDELWPVLLYFGHSGVMHGIILRKVGDTAYEKLGVLPYLKVDPETGSSSQGVDHCYLIKRDYGPPHKPLKLHCELKSMNLV